MSCRSCGVVRAQAGKAAWAASIAAPVCAASACAYSPTTSFVSDGLMSRVTPAPSTQSPAMKFLCSALIAIPGFSTPDFVRAAPSNQPPPRQIAHERARPERPTFALFAGTHTVDEPPEFRRADGHDVAGLVGEAHAGRPAIGDRREHRAEQQDQSVGIGVV